MPASETVKKLQVPKGFTVSLWAEEPMVINSTAIDIDSRGRVWIAEGLNYRFFRNGEFQKAPGCDRIKILEDTDGDGRADKVTIFAENIYPVPMGLAIQERWENGVYKGCRVFTGNSPDLLVLEDTTGNDKADKRYPLLTGFGGYDHDHGVHGMTLGPDGKLYFTQGNGGLDKRDAKLPAGTTFDVTDKSGRRLSMAEQGTTFRCNLDGSQLEVLAWRFRNNYECSVNSFGQVFVSDNDDDGNRGSRMLWLMEGGNYGYKDPRSKRHWAEEQPGIVPKLVGTGNGSPCGILVYEGREFPPEYVGNVFQVDAGTRQINYHPLKRIGAAFRTEYEVFLKGTDPNFRPIDIAIAPDGSMLVADWYDAGVGGHRFTDQTTGRIYRVTPPGSKSKTTKAAPPDLKSPAGQIAALLSSNNATRFVAREKLLNDGDKSRQLLLDVMSHGLPYERARALFVLGSMPSTALTDIDGALRDTDPRIREQAIRILGSDCSAFGAIGSKTESKQVSRYFDRIASHANDPEAGVRREVALSLSHLDRELCPPSPDFVKSTMEPLVRNWDGVDRYYLEALRLLLVRLPDERLKTIFDSLLSSSKLDGNHGHSIALPPYFPTSTNDAFARNADISLPACGASKLLGLAWAVESAATLPALEELANGHGFDGVEIAVENTISSFRNPEAGEVLIRRFARNSNVDRRLALIAMLTEKIGGPWSKIRTSPTLEIVADAALGAPELQLAGLRLIGAAGMKSRLNATLKMIRDESAAAVIRAAAFDVVARLSPDVAKATAVSLLKQRPNEKDTAVVVTALKALSGSDNLEVLNTMTAIISDDGASSAIRSGALRSLGSSKAGADRLIRMLAEKKLHDSLNGELQFVLHNHTDPAIRELAIEKMPLPKSPDGRTLAQLSRLLRTEKGAAKQGLKIFQRDQSDACGRCHRVEGVGQWVGPDLSSIGIKYAKPEMLFHIINPSAAIGYNLDAYAVVCTDGKVLTGLIAEEYPDRIVIKTALNERLSIARAQIESMQKSKKSLMPDGLLDKLKDKDIVDLVEYLSTLRRESQTVGEFAVIGPMPKCKVGFGASKSSRNPENGGGNSRTLSAGRDGYVDLTALFGGQPDREAALRFSIALADPQKVKIVLTGKASFGLSIDGKSTHLESPQAGSGEPSRIAEVDLAKGAHTVAIRVPGEAAGLIVTVVTDKQIQIGK